VEDEVLWGSCLDFYFFENKSNRK